MKPQLQTGILLAIIIIGILLGIVLLYNLAALVLLVLIAIVFTNGIDPLVLQLQRIRIGKHYMPRALATLIVILGAVLVLLGIFAVLLVTAVNESVNFAQHTWPTAQSRFLAWATSMSTRYPYIPQPHSWLSRFNAQSGQITGYLISTTHAVFGFVGGLFSVLTVLILTVLFTIFKDGISYTFAQFIPPKYQARVLEVSHLAATKMGGWLRGQLTLALVIASVTILGMLLFRVPYAVLIGIIAGLGELIPMVGGYLGMIPALIIVLVASPFLLWKVFAVVLFFILMMQVENYYLGPKIMQHHAELPPVTTILALLTGGTLLGIVGALLAIPLSAFGRVIMLEAVFPAIQGKSRQEIDHGRPGSVVPLPMQTDEGADPPDDRSRNA